MRPYFLILIILISKASFTQNITTAFDKSFDLEADYFVGVDDLEYVYYVKNNTLFKQSEEEKLNYTNVSLGNISMVDIQNPFKIIVFYENFNAVMLLDNKLNELSKKIDFTRESLFNNVSFVSRSSENNIWLFADDNKLHLYDYHNYTDRIQTQAISFYKKKFNPIFLISTFKYAWILGEEGLIQFNEYGNYINYIEIEGLDLIVPFRKGLIYLKNEEFYYFNEGKTSKVLIEKKRQIEDIHVNNSLLSVFDGLKVYQYKIK